jgi:hypothetical protein
VTKNKETITKSGEIRGNDECEGNTGFKELFFRSKEFLKKKDNPT